MVANDFEGVPWMVSGAKHSADVGRVLAYAAMGGNEGVIAPGDLKVSATAGTADGNVHMSTGAVAILNRSANAASQMYVERALQVSDIPIASTGSVGRSDLIVARVEDPQYGKYPPPADTDNGPYVFPRVISGVDPNTTEASQLGGAYVNDSMYAVARLDIPANTSAIDSSMIKDLRRLARPQTWQVPNQQPGKSGGEELLITDTAWKDWPSNAVQLRVPEWATHAYVSITLNPVGTDGHASDFDPRINFGGLLVNSMSWDYNGAPADAYQGAEKILFGIFGELDVTSLQGKTVVVKPQAMRTYTANTGKIFFDSFSQIVFDIRFQQRVV